MIVSISVIAQNNELGVANSPTPFLGIAMQKNNIQIQSDPAIKNGIFIQSVLFQTAAYDAGLRAGDIILNYDSNYVHTVSPNQELATFKRYLKDHKKVGDSLKLKILRQNNIIQTEQKTYSLDAFKSYLNQVSPNISLNFRLQSNFQVIPFDITLKAKPFERIQAPSSNHELFPNIKTDNPTTRLISEYLNKHNQLSHYDEVKKFISQSEYWDDSNRLSLLRFIKQDPLHASNGTIPIFKKLANKLYNSPFQLKEILQLYQFGDHQNKTFINNIYPSSYLHLKTAQDHIDWLKTRLVMIEKKIQLAFENVTSENKTFIYSQLDSLYNDICSDFALASYTDSTNFVNSQKLVSYMNLVDINQLIDALDGLSFLSQKAWQRSFKKALLNDKSFTKKNDSNYLIDIPFLADRLVVSGPDHDRHDKQAAIIVDLGGNDTYLQSLNPDSFLSVIVDFEGDDSYISSESLSQAAACLNMSLLIDIKGNDTYIAQKWGQGVGIFGLGLLMDFHGNDRYIANGLCQGVGFAGIGGIWDKKGHDSYESQGFSQAVGLPRGMGFIYDGAGNDLYRSMGVFESAYGTNHIFKSASQGFGMGFRNIASGGLGLLIDQSGKDTFLAGNFSQATGYFYGLGVLINLGNESDYYESSRYSMAAAAHQAVGIFYDQGGDDEYKGIKDVNLSAAWDQSVTSFFDEGGNDKYYCYDYQFCMGASDQSSFSIFIDQKGNNNIYGNINRLASQNNYHHGKSLSVVFLKQNQDKFLINSVFINNNLLFIRK